MKTYHAKNFYAYTVLFAFILIFFTYLTVCRTNTSNRKKSTRYFVFRKRRPMDNVKYSTSLFDFFRIFSHKYLARNQFEFVRSYLKILSEPFSGQKRNRVSTYVWDCCSLPTVNLRKPKSLTPAFEKNYEKIRVIQENLIKIQNTFYQLYRITD